MRAIYPCTGAMLVAALALGGCSHSDNGGGDKPVVLSSPPAITGPNQVILKVDGMH